LNASGWAPAKLTVEMVRAKGYARMPQTGALSVTVPGVVAGWEAMRKKLGTQSFATLLRPAIQYAEEGFPVTELIAAAWQGASVLPDAHPSFKSTYLPGGRAPGIGEVFRNPDLARSLRSIASKGRNGFYKGSTAAAIVQLSHDAGGALELADLAEYEAEWVEPIATTYQGWTVSELPPNGQGIAVLLMLNLMDRFPISQFGHNSAKALHVMIEAKKLAYADMLRYVADPRFSVAPVDALISKSFAQARSSDLHLNRARSSVPPASAQELKGSLATDTVYLAAVDKDGNMVSLIQSLYCGFGSGLVAPGTGFALQNRGSLFSLDPRHPNALEPRKRPLHTIIPGFLQKKDLRIAFGIMGGWNQAQAHAQFVSNLVDFNMNIQAALEAPRFTKKTFEGLDVEVEPRIPQEARTELLRLGHQLKVLSSPYSGEVGGGQAVMRDGKGVNYGASDPRKDGAAIPEAPPLFGPRATGTKGDRPARLPEP